MHLARCARKLKGRSGGERPFLRCTKPILSRLKNELYAGTYVVMNVMSVAKVRQLNNHYLKRTIVSQQNGNKNKSIKASRTAEKLARILFEAIKIPHYLFYGL